MISTSHIRTAEVFITNANEQIAQATIRELAKLLNVQVVTAVQDTYGHARNVLLGISLGTGFGIEIRDGRISVVGDDYNAPIKLSKFKDMFLKHYKATAIKMAMQSLGYNTKYVTEDGKIHIRGVKYA